MSNGVYSAEIRQLRTEFGNLTFAAVTKVCLKQEKHYDPDTKTYSYYFGYALDRSVEHRQYRTREHSIWFQLPQHLRRPIHIGPIYWKQPLPKHIDFVPRPGDIIFGQTVKKKKGLMFKWWSVQGYPFLKFTEMLRYKRCRQKDMKTSYFNLIMYKENYHFRCQECKHPIPSTSVNKKEQSRHCYICGKYNIEPNPLIEDSVCKTNTPPSEELLHNDKYASTFVMFEDLWIMYKILFLNDFSPLMRLLQFQYYYCPSIFNDNMRKTFLSYDPVRFMFLLSWFCQSTQIYHNFLQLCNQSNLYYNDSLLEMVNEENKSEFSKHTLKHIVDPDLRALVEDNKPMFSAHKC